jgi:hypothetical protein
MPRIIDVDTEAFAPTYQKAYKEREPLGDVSRRRMAADLQLLGQAMPYVSEGIKGIDQYVVTPIQQAMKESREEEYKAKKAGEMPFEISETTRQKIAKQRLAEKEKQKPFDTSAWEKEAEEMYDITKMKGAPDLEAQRPDYGAVGEEAAKMFSEKRPEFGELSVPVGEAGTDAMIARQRVEQQMAQRLKEQEQAGPVTRPTVIARHPVTGELRAVAGQPSAGLERGSPAYEMEVSRQRTGLPRKPAAATPAEPAPTRMMPEHPVPTGYQWPARGRYTAPGAPTEGFAGAEAPAEPTQTAQMAKTATTTARAGARTEAEPVAPTEPAKPKTLATVTDDELSDVKRRLEKMVEQDPEDKELANRLEMVNLEQRHRGEKIEFEDWAPMARAADTVEEQRKVLELAKRVRMPVEGFESLLTSPFERAKLKALGAKGEKGLFPEVARPLTSWEIDKKQTEIRINQLKAQGLSDKQAADQALAEKRRADAGLSRARTETEETLREPRYAAAAEKPFLMHSQEELNEAKRQEVLGLLPKKIQKYDADIARLRRMAAAKSGGRGLSKEDIEWAKLWEKDWDKAVDNAANVATTAKREAVTLERQAAAAQMEAEGKAGDYKEYEKIFAKISPYDPNYAKVQADLFEKRAAAGAAQRSATLAKANFEAARTASGEAQTKLEQAQKAGDEGRQHLRFIYGRSGPGRAEAGAAPAAPTAPAKPATTPAKAAVAHKEGDKSKDKNGKPIVWHDGKWTYPD